MHFRLGLLLLLSESATALWCACAIYHESTDICCGDRETFWSFNVRVCDIGPESHAQEEFKNCCEGIERIQGGCF
ncbi:hypothetical protein ANO14919_097910 [Xylariales sp. No.14919]|nr:hypothetical protein ANO14919_097910 [Xylariales sp. No.14919]